MKRLCEIRMQMNMSDPMFQIGLPHLSRDTRDFKERVLLIWRMLTACCFQSVKCSLQYSWQQSNLRYLYSVLMQCQNLTTKQRQNETIYITLAMHCRMLNCTHGVIENLNAMKMCICMQAKHNCLTVSRLYRQKCDKYYHVIQWNISNTCGP